VLEQEGPDYGSALTTGFRSAKGKYILTMDADLSHQPTFILDIWNRRRQAEVIIASRYVKGGTAVMPKSRFWLSRVLNQFFSRGLSIPVRDLSSGFRLYKAELVRDKDFTAHNFDILPEILVKVYSEGWQVKEVPFHYAPRKHGSSNARVFIFGLAYLRTFYALWKLRNSVLSADYDDRAFNSPIWLQRYWQRSRYRHITELIKGEGKVLDVGCGSSRIIGALPEASVALDVANRKLRYARKFKKLLVVGSGFNLPFADKSFPCVLCSQVIEHVPFDSPILDELDRVLAPGGLLVLGTPDYDHWKWVYIEKVYGKVAPGAYADEHITHYNRQQLIDIFEKRGYKVEATRYILRGELILAFNTGTLAQPIGKRLGASASIYLICSSV
jgi:ubiquinone/menaquinone biosynthesis C-methylase UbiE